MKKVFVIFALLLLIAVVGWISLSNEKKINVNSKPIVTIGASLPLTIGGRSGLAAEKAIKYAVTEANKNLGNKYSYKVLVEDNQLSSKLIANIANKFINLDKVNATISIWGAPYNVMAEINKGCINPVVNLYGALGEQNRSSYDVGVTSSLDNLTDAYLTSAKSNNVKNVAILALDTSLAYNKIADGLEEKLEKNGIHVESSEKVKFGFEDYRSILTRLKNKNVDTYVLLLLVQDQFRFLKQLKEMNMDSGVSITSIASWDEMELSEKKIFAGNWFVSASAAVNKDFLDEWNRTQDIPILGITAESYALTEIFINAIENVRTDNVVPSTDEIIDYIYNKGEFDTKPFGKLVLNKETGQFRFMPKVVFIDENGNMQEGN